MQKLLKFIIMCAAIVASIGAASLILAKKSQHTFDIKVLETKENIVPVLVIGSGCAGFPAAIYAARGNLDTVLIAGQPFGQLGTTTKVENFPGMLDQLGPDIMQKLQTQCEYFGGKILYDSVKSITRSDDGIFEVITEGGKTINALTIIIATGAAPLKLGIPGESQFWGRGVTTCAICDAPFHKDKDVVVIGGGDSASEEAQQLSPYAKSVTIIVRKGSMRAAPSMQDRLKTVENIHVIYDSEVKAIYGDDTGVTSVDIYNNTTNTITNKPVSGVFLAIGHTPNSSLVKNLVSLDSDGYIITKGKTQETNVPGIFAAGDVEDKTYRQAGVAAGSGIRAGLDALNYLQERGFNAAVAKSLESHYLNVKEPLEVKKKVLIDIVSEEDFDALINQNSVVVVDFYTTNCPSCSHLLPTYEKVAAQLEGKVVCAKCNAEDVLELARRYKLSSVPSVMLFKDGQLVDQSLGSVPEEELMAFIQQAL